jgi:hypothetical protein
MLLVYVAGDSVILAQFKSVPARLGDQVWPSVSEGSKAKQKIEYLRELLHNIRANEGWKFPRLASRKDVEYEKCDSK